MIWQQVTGIQLNIEYKDINMKNKLCYLLQQLDYDRAIVAELRCG